jgi:hypothetical protein
VVVFAVKDQTPDASDERERLKSLFGEDPFPDATWVNLHYVIKKCDEMQASIDDHRNVWFTKDRKQTRRSLEALEWEFGIARDPEIRSHSYSYVDGRQGGMHVLETITRHLSGEAASVESRALERYCRADVESMFKISRDCEKGLFSRRQRGLRR